MDALPINEDNETDYRSQTPQRMHACGHDGHTSIGLAVARMLAAQRGAMRGRVKFVFQPAEEIGKGALAMIDDGVLLDPRPEVSIGLHLWNQMPVGHVALTPGGFMAGAALFTVQIQGRGGHGALPHETADPVLAMAHVITSLQSIVSRNVDPVDTAVVSVTQVQAGNAANVIPDQAMFRGTFRFFNTQVQTLLTERMQTIIDGGAVTLGCKATISIDAYSPPVVNDPTTSARLRAGFTRVAPGFQYHDDARTMAAEDMAYFLDKAPGVFFFVGSSNPERGLNYPHHHPRFDFDEEALVVGASLLASAVSDYVLPE